MLSAIAQALDVREAAGRSLAESLADAAAREAAALVLDNFEQVVDAAPLVADLLGAAPGLKVLVTSRAVLRLYGEHEYPVPPLALPDRRTAPRPQHLAQFEAVRLFVERAQAARPDFALTDDERRRRRRDLPPAGRAAAGDRAGRRARPGLPPRALLQRLERRLPLLTGGARDLPARQQTLRDAIAWSYDLLEPDEQALFRRLAVFRGCTLEAAEAVCAGEPPRPGATSIALSPLRLDVLDGLDVAGREEPAAPGGSGRRPVLVRDAGDRPRVRAGAPGGERRRRAPSGAGTSSPPCAGRERPSRAGLGPEQAAWFARLEQEHDNLRAALRLVPRSTVRRSRPCGWRSALWWFWSAHGHVREGRER